MADGEGSDDEGGHQGDLTGRARALFQLLQAAATAARAGRVAEATRLDEHAGKLMSTGLLARHLYSYFRRHGATTAEDLVQEVWVTVLAGRYHVHSNPLAYLMRIAKARATDALRSRLKRQEDRTEELPDSDVVREDVFGRGLGAASAGLLDCVRRRFALFAASSKTNRGYAELLEYKTMGLSDKEIASILFDKGEEAVTDQEVSRIGSRLTDARIAAASYLAGCEE